MLTPKTSKAKSNKEVVHFSNKGTFYYQGILFKVFKTDLKNPKAPQLAILNLDTNERLSGLFNIGSNIYQGDTKSDTGTKQYFRLRFIDQNTIELTDFESALIQIGTITPQEDYTPILEPYRAPKHLLETEQEQGLLSEKKSDILNHNQRAQLDIGF